MKTPKEIPLTFLILVPHRDTRVLLRKYSRQLFKQGYEGAFHFPHVVPLACLSKPLDPDELKNCARILRESACENKFSAKKGSVITLPMKENNISLFGLQLDLTIPPERLAYEKFASFFSPPVIGTCILHEEMKEFSQIPLPPQISFRAAAVANMSFRQLQSADGAIGYEWKIGKLNWLPKQ